MPRHRLSPTRYLGLILVLGVGAALAGYTFFLAPHAFEPDVPPEVRAQPILPDAPQKAQDRISVPLKPGESGRSGTANKSLATPSAAGVPYSLTRGSGPTPVQKAWVLDVLTTERREEADRIFDRLLHAPYQVYAFAASQGGRNRYQVRVGFFDSRLEAEKAGRVLVQKYKLPQPKAVRADAQERARFASPSRSPGRKPRTKP